MIILLCFFFFFLVIFNNVLTAPVVTVNIKVRDAPAIPAGIPTTVAYEAILKVPNDVDSVYFVCIIKSNNVFTNFSNDIFSLFNFSVEIFFYVINFI